ncbi:MAG TPA: hypothetical protein VFS83_12630 [Ktedonobacterales bacterium]|nr:hypothetical protein [Ktedonobacterales bacterium]
MSEETQAQPASIEAMFVQVGSGMSSDNQSITLHGAGGATLFFADRPDRVVGHVSTQKFVNEWGNGENSFAQDPPNAVVTFLESDDTTPEDATVVLRNPQMAGDSLTYNIEVLEGTLPTSAGACSLFIDPIGRPLSPMSVAGVRRRQRRRF